MTAEPEVRKHFYRGVLRLGIVAVSRHAQARMIAECVTQEAFERPYRNVCGLLVRRSCALARAGRAAHRDRDEPDPECEQTGHDGLPH